MEGSKRLDAAEIFDSKAGNEPTEFERGMRRVRPLLGVPARAAIYASGLEVTEIKAIEGIFVEPTPGVDNYPDAN